MNFYPRPPRGGRPAGPEFPHGANKFLPTPSARRATFSFLSSRGRAIISTHALREEGDAGPQLRGRVPRHISTHALREEGDQHIVSLIGYFLIFLPTPSARRATHRGGFRVLHGLFLPTPSARRATAAPCNGPARPGHFYPRPPRGGRHDSIGNRSVVCDFYPRPPRGGRPWSAPGSNRCTGYFYPRPPRGGRPMFPSIPNRLPNFYPRPPRGGRL